MNGYGGWSENFREALNGTRHVNADGSFAPKYLPTPDGGIVKTVPRPGRLKIEMVYQQVVVRG